MIFILIAAGLFIMLLLTLSGAYFIRSILVPVRQLSQSARQIAQGDFAVRIDKAKDDEIGQLVDAINDMAGEPGRRRADEKRLYLLCLPRAAHAPDRH